ncbi:phage protein D, partial [Salmonella enterica subsp. enterica serovar Kentucky]|nr:phage protein D [Salmonella enterica subsp. enterica serovar Kentucky]
KRLASEYGYTVKVTATELIFSHLPTLRCLAPVKTLRRTDVSHCAAIHSLHAAVSVANRNKSPLLNRVDPDSERRVPPRRAAGAIPVP